MYKSMVVYLRHESKNYVKKRESYLNFILYDVKQLIDSNKFYTERKSIACVCGACVCVCARARACMCDNPKSTNTKLLYTFDK